MDAQELRIGNYVYAQSGKLVVNRDSIYKVENVNIQSARKYEPIPLTEEWLLKFGFEKDGVPTGYTIDDKFQMRQCWLNIMEKTKEWNFEAYNDDNWIRISKPQYIHQLQNLYFALTGEELQLK